MSFTDASGPGTRPAGSGSVASSLPSLTGQAAPKADEMMSPWDGTPWARLIAAQSFSFATLAARTSRSAYEINANPAHKIL